MARVCAVVAMTMATPARAALLPGQICVDLDADGACGPADRAITPDADGDVRHDEGDCTSAGPRPDIVVSGVLRVTTLLDLRSRGNLVLQPGRITMRDLDADVRLEACGDVRVVGPFKLKGKSWTRIVAGGDIDVGAGAQILNPKHLSDFRSLDVYARTGSIRIGERSTLTGGTDLTIAAPLGTITSATRARLTSEPRGYLDATQTQRLELHGTLVRAGSLQLGAGTPTAPGRVVLADRTIVLSNYENGFLDISVPGGVIECSGGSSIRRKYEDSPPTWWADEFLVGPDCYVDGWPPAP